MCQIKDKDHSALSILLMRIESDLFINHIAKRIWKDHPAIPFFTIHDSILCKLSNTQMIEELMKEEITAYLGFEANLKQELLTPDKFQDKYAKAA